MKISSLKIASFGKFSDKEIEFSDGINVVYGDNESGKSTVEQFMLNMFYGFFRRDIKSRRMLDTYEKYLPWEAPTKYLGSMTAEKDSRKFIIRRNFLKEKAQAAVFNVDGEDISEEFPFNSILKQREPAEILIGLSRTAYSGTLNISQRMCKADKGLGAELGERIAAMSQEDTEDSADQSDISAKNAIERLKAQIDEIGNERKNSPVKACKENIKALEAEMITAIDNERAFFELRRRIDEKVLNKNDLSHRLNGFLAKKAAKKLDKINELRNRTEALKLKCREFEEYGELSQDDINSAIRKYDIITQLKNENNALEDKILRLKSENTDKEIPKAVKSSAGVKAAAAIISIIGLVSGFFNPWLFILSGLGFAVLMFFLLGDKKKNDETARKISDLKADYDNRLSILQETYNERQSRINNFSHELRALLTSMNIESEEELPITLEKNTLFINYNENLKIALAELSAVSEEADLDELKRLSEYEYEGEIFQTETILRRDIERLSAEISADNARLDEFGKKSKTTGEIQSLLSCEKTALSELEYRRTVLENARDRIINIQKELHSQLAPRLNKMLSSLAQQVTFGKYKRLTVTRDFDILAETDFGIKPVPARELSSGTSDLIYILARLALADFICGEDNELPLIFDDSFTNLDDTRLTEVLHLLSERAEKSQIIIFTCQKREANILKSENLPFNELFLSE